MNYTSYIDFKGVELRVEYDYQPEEKAVMYYSDGSGYPGCPESVDITAIHLIHGKEKIDVMELCEAYYDEILEAIRNSASDE